MTKIIRIRSKELNAITRTTSMDRLRKIASDPTSSFDQVSAALSEICRREGIKPLEAPRPTPLEVLREVWSNESLPIALRMRAARAGLSFYPPPVGNADTNKGDQQ